MESQNNMFNNKNIVKYCVKYFFVLTICAYMYNLSTSLINQKSDIANLIGTALFAGLFIGSMLIFKSDVTKLVKNLKEEKSNE